VVEEVLALGFGVEEVSILVGGEGEVTVNLAAVEAQVCATRLGSSSTTRLRSSYKNAMSSSIVYLRRQNFRISCRL
jgi:hypothetical protein